MATSQSPPVVDDVPFGGSRLARYDTPLRPGIEAYKAVVMYAFRSPVIGASRGERRRDRCPGESCVVDVDEVGMQRPILAAAGLAD